MNTQSAAGGRFRDGVEAAPAVARRAAPTEVQPAPLWVRVLAAAIPMMPAGRYRFLHWLRVHRAPFLAWMSPARERCSFICDLRDSIAREACFTGQYEPQETAVISAILNPGMTFVDVGANWGYFSLLGAKIVGESGRVISLEPEPRQFAMLAGNLARNGCRQAVAIEAAAAADPGFLTLAGFEEESDNWGVSMVVDPRYAPAFSTFSAPARRLDDVVGELGIDRVDLLKMDIEGAEDFALRGMSNGLGAHLYRRVLLELHPQILEKRGRSPVDVCAPLIRSGYQAWRIDHSPSASRRAAYASSCELRELLSPMPDLSASLDAWPHLLWLAPGIEAP